MARIASLPAQRELQSLLARQREQLSAAAVQQASALRIADYGELGADTGRLLTAQGAIDQIEGQTRVARRVGASLTMYETRMAEMQTIMKDLSKAITDVLGGLDGDTLLDRAALDYRQFRAAANAENEGEALFGGSRSNGAPLTPETMADTVTTLPADAIRDDGVRGSARLGDGVDLRYGVGLSEFGGAFVAGFATLAGLGTLPARPTAAQLATLTTAKQQIEAGLEQLRAADARNGGVQNRVDQMIEQGETRRIALTELAGSIRDSDTLALATEITARRTALQVSYEAYSVMTQISLVDVLR